MPVDLVIFDCDGVLVDTEQLNNQWIAEQITQAGLPIDATRCRHRFVGLAMSAIRPKLLAEDGIDIGADFVERWQHSTHQIFSTGVQSIDGVEAAIDELDRKGIAYCVGSSGTVEKMQLTLGSAGLLGRLETVLYSSSMVKNGKPAPDLFLHAAQQMGVDPGRCIVVEDSAYGAAAARAAGMVCLGYIADPLTDAKGMAKQGASLFHDMRELPRLVAQLGIE